MNIVAGSGGAGGGGIVRVEEIVRCDAEVLGEGSELVRVRPSRPLFPAAERLDRGSDRGRYGLDTGLPSEVSELGGAESHAVSPVLGHICTSSEIACQALVSTVTAGSGPVAFSVEMDSTETPNGRLRQAVSASGKSKRAIARESGMELSYLYRLLKDRVALTREKAVQLAPVLGADPAWLLGVGSGWTMREEAPTYADEDARDLVALFRALDKYPETSRAILRLARLAAYARHRPAIQAFADALEAKSPAPAGDAAAPGRRSGSPGRRSRARAGGGGE
jgi:transcriptional regulator with XRE-family HTH domain